MLPIIEYYFIFYRPVLATLPINQIIQLLSHSFYSKEF